MKKRHILTLILLCTALTLSAQSNYSPCYTNNMSKGNTAFSQGKYSEARTYYSNAKQCAGGNPSAAQQKISACDAKIKAQKESGPKVQEPKGSVGYASGSRGVTYMPDLSIPVAGQVFVEVHIDTEGTVVETHVINNSKYPTTVTDNSVLSNCVAVAKTVKYRKGNEELRILVFK